MIQSLARSLRVIEAVAERQPIGVSDLSRALDMPKSTVQRILVTAASQGWLDVDAGPVVLWTVGDRLRNLSRRESRDRGLREVALPVLKRLRDATDETVHLALPHDNSMILIERLDSTQTIRAVNEIGSLTPMAATSTGIAILGRSGEDRVEEIIREGIDQYLETTVVDPEEFRAEVALSRREGFAVVTDQLRPNIVAFGAAIVDQTGSPLAAISISMPNFRYDPSDREHLGRLVRDGAAEISASLAS